ncbi:uncharacterized protein [Penaeus vannamei]|uniref:uncharacterized protein n=1 Tax=Penaeus vannamei TaxID=6689 RepID=UPI00387F9228
MEDQFFHFAIINWSDLGTQSRSSSQMPSGHRTCPMEPPPSKVYSGIKNRIQPLSKLECMPVILLEFNYISEAMEGLLIRNHIFIYKVCLHEEDISPTR